MRILTKDTVSKIGEKVELSGWVDVRRDHGKLIFIDLRDRSGVIQLVFTPKNEKAYALANSLRSEWVIQVSGVLKARPENMINSESVCGTVELPVEEMEILNEAQTPPFPLDTDGLELDEELRAKYRYVDLRRARMQKNLRFRSQLIDAMRQELFAQDFTEVETPLLTKTTPEGARDFVVPSRHNPGKFFALPQSPQQYKQLLMTGGLERYFQVARALRDEDLRADRAFEHTQLDLEMSFVSQDDVLNLVEKMMVAVATKFNFQLKNQTFPRLTFQEAMEKFGADKFDLRTEEEKKENVLSFAWVTNFPAFEKTKEGEWTFTHNPFTMPKEEDLENLFAGKDIEKIGTWQYDLVCNGFELGSGSIRAHKPEILRAVFKVMGYSEERVEAQFGHMLAAFNSGTPPHGGIGIGLDRLVMILQGEKFLREVVAFPQTSSGRTSVMDAPSELGEEQLQELGLKIEKKKKSE